MLPGIDIPPANFRRRMLRFNYIVEPLAKFMRGMGAGEKLLRGLKGLGKAWVRLGGWAG